AMPCHSKELGDRVSAVIAERVFRTSEGSSVVAKVHAPEKMAQSSEWSCRVEIQGLEAPVEKLAIGVDSFQALYLGIHLLSVQVDKSAATLTFLDGKAGECDTPLIMPWGFSSSLKAEMYRLIEERIMAELDSR